MPADSAAPQRHPLPVTANRKPRRALDRVIFYGDRPNLLGAVKVADGGAVRDLPAGNRRGNAVAFDWRSPGGTVQLARAICFYLYQEDRARAVAPAVAKQFIARLPERSWTLHATDIADFVNGI